MSGLTVRKKVKDQDFQYPAYVDFKETVTVNGKQVPRYGRLRDRKYIHMGAEAPYREDGALFDLLRPGIEVSAVNKKPTRVVVTPTKVRVVRPYDDGPMWPSEGAVPGGIVHSRP